MLGLYNTVTQYWTASGATTKVADFIAAAGRQGVNYDEFFTNNGFTAAEKKAYNDLWDNIPNATYTYKGKLSCNVPKDEKAEIDVEAYFIVRDIARGSRDRIDGSITRAMAIITR